MTLVGGVKGFGSPPVTDLLGEGLATHAPVDRYQPPDPRQLTETTSVHAVDWVAAGLFIAGSLSKLGGIATRVANLPAGLKAVGVGLLLIATDYFWIDEIRAPNGKLGIRWGADYHIDTVVGGLGAILFLSGLGLHLSDSAEFYQRVVRFLVGGGPGLAEAVSNPLKNTFSFFERISVPVLLTDFVLQQFTHHEAEDDAQGVRRTPDLSIVGGLAFCFAGNRAAIRLFGIRPSGQRFYFILDRLLDMYMMYTSGNTNFLEADWARIGLKYNTGWVVGQVRGNILRFALARAYRNRFLDAVRLELGGFRSTTIQMSSLGFSERAFLNRLLLRSDRYTCQVTLTRGGRVASQLGAEWNLSAGEKAYLLGALGHQGKRSLLTRFFDLLSRFFSRFLRSGTHTAIPRTYEDLFVGGKEFIELSVSPVLNKRGLAAFSLLHDTFIGTLYDFVRGEYLIFGDGWGYAQWTLLRSVTVLPLRTAFKAWLGWHSGIAIFFDQLMGRFTIDPYFTNWTRLYAKQFLWWPNYVTKALASRDLGAFLLFHTGDLVKGANGVDTWNRNHFPADLFLPEFLRDPHGSPVDTYAPGYGFIAKKLREGALKAEEMGLLDEIVAELIREAREGIRVIQTGHYVARYGVGLQCVIDHAEVYAAIAYAVRQRHPEAFSTTFGEHSEWIEEILGKDRPQTAAEVEGLATRFGEYTWFGDTLKAIPYVGHLLPRFTEGRSKGYQVMSIKGRQTIVRWS